MGSSVDGEPVADPVTAPAGPGGVSETGALDEDGDPEASEVPGIRETLEAQMDEWDDNFASLLDQFGDLVDGIAGPLGLDEGSLAVDLIVQPADGEHRAAAIAVLRQWEGLVERHDHLSDRFDACHRAAMAAGNEKSGEGARVRVPIAADRFVTFLELQTKADEGSKGYWCPSRDKHVDYDGVSGGEDESGETDNA